ncbi:hypothetical protein FNH04_03275 [Streptomyces phyllanthi]|uniref:Uncharacterized protein n=1 Tax=Streptomyces phyllanthi TaxID=1803180 RepID=A0A5N8VW29_9ACTN|nr:hypothetical protein [Streptomyces phyllanthi]
MGLAFRRCASPRLHIRGQVGLDRYQVRHWTAWHRHVTVAMLALCSPGRRRCHHGADQARRSHPAGP